MTTLVIGTVLLIAILFLAAIFNTLTTEIENKAFAQKTTMTENTVAELVKPAVVQVDNSAAISLSVQDAGIDMEKLQNSLNALSSQGSLDLNNARQVLDEILSLIYQDPTEYIAPSSDVSNLSVLLNATGSGFIVTPDGYVVTNAHVVRSSDTSIDQDIRQNFDIFAATFIDQIIADAKGALNNIIIPAYPRIASLDLTKQEQQALIIAFAHYYKTAPFHIIDVKPHMFVEMRISVPGVVSGGKLVPAEVIPTATGQEDGKDVAIIKIEGSNLPTVSLGDEHTLKILDDIIAIGFPGIVTEAFTTASTVAEPSVTKGQFSGFQPTVYGFNVIQTSTAISPGNSGGPAVDASGKVIGITTFTLRDPTTGQSVSGYSYLIPVSIVKEYLNRINVQPQESQFTKMYGQALAEYDQQNYSKALETLEQVNRMVPGNPDVENLISSVQNLISNQSGQGTLANDNQTNASTTKNPVMH